QAHHDPEADQHAKRGKAPTVDGPPPTRNLALIDPRESHWWLAPHPPAGAGPSPLARGEGLSAQLSLPACGERVGVRGLSPAEIGSMPSAPSGWRGRQSPRSRRCSRNG